MDKAKSIDPGKTMSWDWEKLKDQQHHRGGGKGGGAPPQFDELLDRFKKFKLPGGPLLILILVVDFQDSFCSLPIPRVGTSIGITIKLGMIFGAII